ncbi:phosphoenolpyruvate synthase [Thermoplasmatales archaeon BRNA1]|nr:phosphoenolpyruvate synthase [Thermoplasmatales archaeon BRNA1]
MDETTTTKRIIDVNELRVTDVPIVGGKGANLGELTSSGFPVPHAFVLTTVSYDEFVNANKLMPKIMKEIKGIDPNSDDSLVAASEKIRAIFDKSKIPAALKKDIEDNYKILCGSSKQKTFVAVRSSATAEDLPDASFAGQQETYLNVASLTELYEKIIMCWSSLFTARAISYREKQGYSHEEVKLAVVVQRMVNSEFSGIMFTVNPNNGAKNIIVEGGYGLGEAIVGGEITPDTYTIDKVKMDITDRRFSTQKWKYARGPKGGLVKVDIPEDLQKAQKIDDAHVREIAEIGRQVEIHYEKPMDMEWCIEEGNVYLVQARPITTLNKIKEANTSEGPIDGGDVVLTGLGASPGMASGRVCIYDEGMSLDVIKDGDVLVTKMTMPDMVPAMSRSVAIVTDEGGMTCHAAIISRELGTPCVVGTGEATSALKNGDIVTVDGSTGTVYRGEIKGKAAEQAAPAAATAVFAEQVPITGTKVMVNMSMPNKAEEIAQLPCDGVGLLRSEFLFTNYIGEHPCAVIADGRSQELIDKLADGVGKVARAFYPRPVTLRTSDFKTNEYRDMKGGANYEPNEDNPMIGWRGCSRYVSENYREAFMCELKAIKKVRDEMGMKNVNIMLPFVRTIDEVKEITAMMESVGLKRGLDLKLYFMAEVPVNIFMAEEFCKYCDWFSIGSNDLTQLTMGCDRDSDILGKMGYFDERNPGVKAAIKHLIKVAHKYGNHVSICGQAPSVYPDFCEFLVETGIDCISLNPDTFVKTKKIIASAEQRVLLNAARRNAGCCDD